MLIVGICFSNAEAKTRDRIEANKKRDDKREQKKVLRDKARDKHISNLQTLGEKHGFLSHSDSEYVCGLALFDGVMEKYSTHIKNDYYRITASDQYGRVSDKQLEDWKWHLLEVVDTCKLGVELDESRKVLRQIVLWCTDSNFDAEKEQFDDANLKRKLLKEYQKKPSKVDDKKKAAFRFYKDVLFVAYNEYTDQQDNTLLDRFDSSMTGIEFEYFCSEILDEAGWLSNVLPGSGDHGADIIAETDGISIAIQCKKYSKPVGNTPVQEITAARKHYNADKACVVTNSTYTKGAQTLAKSNDVVLLHYTDLPKLVEYVW